MNNYSYSFKVKSKNIFIDNPHVFAEKSKIYVLRLVQLIQVKGEKEYVQRG